MSRVCKLADMATTRPVKTGFVRFLPLQNMSWKLPGLDIIQFSIRSTAESRQFELIGAEGTPNYKKKSDYKEI